MSETKGCIGKGGEGQNRKRQSSEHLPPMRLIRLPAAICHGAREEITTKRERCTRRAGGTGLARRTLNCAEIEENRTTFAAWCPLALSARRKQRGGPRDHHSRNRSRCQGFKLLDLRMRFRMLPCSPEAEALNCSKGQREEGERLGR